MNDEELSRRLAAIDLRLARIERELDLETGPLAAASQNPGPPAIGAPSGRAEPPRLEEILQRQTAETEIAAGIPALSPPPLENTQAAAANPPSLAAHLLNYQRHSNTPFPDANVALPPIAPPPYVPPPFVRVQPPAFPVGDPIPAAAAPIFAMADPHWKPGAKPAKPARPAKSQGSLEQTLGLKWTGWIGAIVLLIGVALCIRFVYEKGWLANVPGSVRVSMIALGGFALIAAGEWAYRKIDIIPAASLFGAGIATLFLASYAGHAYFQVYDPGSAFFLMGLCTVAGALIARRGDMVSIGVLSIAGGNIAPLILHPEHPSLTGLLGYLAMLQAVALLLTFTGKHPKWWILRGLSLATTSVWVAYIIASDDYGQSQLYTTLIFCSISALAYQAEMIASTLRGNRRAGNLAARGATAVSILVTTALTVAALWILPIDSTGSRIGFILAEIILIAGLSLGMRRLAIAALAEGFALQASALLVLLVPVALTREAVIIAWILMSIAMAFVGRLRNLISARVMAIGVWMLAIGDLIWRMQNTPDSDAIHNAWLTLGQTSLSAGLFLAWIAALSGETIAYLTLPNRESEHSRWMPLAWLASIASALLWIGVSIGELPMPGATLAIIALAWLLAGADALTPRLQYVLQSLALLAIAAVKWAALDSLQRRLSPDWSAVAQRPILNSLMGTAVLLAVSFPAICAVRKKSILGALEKSKAESAIANLRFALSVLVILVLTFAFSFQIDLVIQQAIARQASFSWPPMQTELLAFTLLWSAAVASLWLAELWAKPQSDSQNRLGMRELAILLVLKFVLIDTLPWMQQSIVATVGFNLYVAAAAVLSLVLLGTSMVSLRPRREIAWPAPGALAAALFTICWAGSFEIDRAVRQGIIPGGSPWPQVHLTLLLLTAWWAGAALTMYLLAPRTRALPARIETCRQAAAGALVLIALKYLAVDTLLFWMLGGSQRAMVLINPQALAGAAVIATLAVLWVPRRHNTANSAIGSLSGFLMMLTALWIGSLEIDRLFTHWIAPGQFNDRDLARQVAISIFWSIFAVLAVIGGFRLRAAPMRYFGLGLFAITLVKVTLVDVSQLSAGYRFMSFMGLGVLLMGTSVLYGKFSPKLLGAAKEEAGTGN